MYIVFFLSFTHQSLNNKQNKSFCVFRITTFSGKIIGTAVVAALSLVFTSIGFVLLGLMTLNKYSV
jgi:hypothetical protein